MSDTPSLYEGMFLFNAALSSESLKNTIDKVLDGIKNRQGTVHKMHEWGRRRLAYAIRRHTEGYYIILYFSLPSLAMKDLWHEWQLMEDLYRFHTLKCAKVIEEIKFKPLVEIA